MMLAVYPAWMRAEARATESGRLLARASQLAALESAYDCSVFVFRDHDSMAGMAQQVLSVLQVLQVYREIQVLLVLLVRQD